MLASKISNPLSGSWITVFELGKYQVLLRMMVNLCVDLKITDNRANDFVVGALAGVENRKFSLENGKQLPNVPMLLGQTFNDHRGTR